MIRLPDPFTDSSAPGFLSAPLQDNEPVLQEELPNGKVLQIANVSAQYWSTEISYPDLYEDEYRIISSAIYKAKKTGDSIGIVLPQYLSHNVMGEDLDVNIRSGSKGGSVVIEKADLLKGNPKIGDLFQLSTHPKVYKIVGYNRNTTDKTLTLDIYPDLFITTDGTEKPVFNNVIFNMKLVSRDGITENVNANGLYQDISFKFRESL